MLNIKPIESNGIRLQAKDDTVTISGSVDISNANKNLLTFFEEVHKNIQAKHMRKVFVDVTELKFINSAGIKEIVTWIMKLNDMPEKERYTIVFQCNPEISWQELTITSLVWLNQKYIKSENI
ncbi:hypothetical protein KAR34_08135 [bacterium]|nr:hypothetical protein [bacterium]